MGRCGPAVILTEREGGREGGRERELGREDATELE